MSSDDYWKNKYEHTWDPASRREKKIAELIQQKTGSEVVLTGLGAGSTEFLSGNASSHGYEKGAPDLHVVGTNIYLEVTGPLSNKVGRDAPLWIRPDKVENARKHYPEHETWLVHCLAKDFTLRVINLNSNFFNQLDKGRFKVIHPWIRGTEETYLAIPASHSYVQSWETLLEKLREIA
jgi:hypothetical protein